MTPHIRGWKLDPIQTTPKKPVYNWFHVPITEEKYKELNEEYAVMEAIKKHLKTDNPLKMVKRLLARKKILEDKINEIKRN